MKNFSLTVDEKNYQVSVIEPMDEYGKDKKTFFSEVPLVIFKSEDEKSTEYDIIDVLDVDSEMTLPDNDKPVSADGRKVVNNKLFEVYPCNYLNMFVSLKRKKPKM